MDYLVSMNFAFRGLVLALAFTVSIPVFAMGRKPTFDVQSEVVQYEETLQEDCRLVLISKTGQKDICQGMIGALRERGYRPRIEPVNYLPAWDELYAECDTVLESKSKRKHLANKTFSVFLVGLNHVIPLFTVRTNVTGRWTTAEETTARADIESAAKAPYCFDEDRGRIGN